MGVGLHQFWWLWVGGNDGGDDIPIQIDVMAYGDYGDGHDDERDCFYDDNGVDYDKDKS